MLRRNAVWLVAIVTIVAGAWIQQAIAAEGPPPPPGQRDQRDQRDPAEMQQRIEQFRQQAAERMKTTLGASDEEWKVLQPRIEKVQTLSRATRGGGGMGFMMMAGRGGPQRGGPGDRPQGDRPQSDRPQSEVEKAGTALQKVLDNKDAPAAEIKTALAALREARAKARAELETAQKELREVVTVRQEAQFVAMGLLD